MSLGLNRRMPALALAAGLSVSVGSALAGNPALGVPGKQISVIDAPRPSTTQSAFVSAYGYSRGPGWSAAQVKRRAKKRSNQTRNKLAHRAKGGR